MANHRRFVGTKLAKPKLRISRAFSWEHHREGWSRVERLVGEHLTCDDGTLFVGAVEDQLFYFGPLNEPWVGVVHQVPHHDLPGFPDLERLLALPSWRESLSKCQGLFVLCDYLRRFLIDKGIKVPISLIPYVSAKDIPQFDWGRFSARTRPRLLHVGEFLRSYQAFFDIETPLWDKQMLRPTDWESHIDRVVINDSVEILPHLENGIYDELLCESVVFLQLKDAPANTTIVECIARATPICVNRVGGVEEYLGLGYPLYHNGDAEQLLADFGRIKEAHEYLCDWQKQAPDDNEFLDRMQGTAVYQTLPLPASQGQGFPRYDLTVLIAVYARLPSLSEQLARLASQQNAPQFEILLWNNDPGNTLELEQIVAKADPKLVIRVIHSSDNIYCGMRMAMPALARSDTVLVCDDDVMPEAHYLRTLYDAYQKHGPEVAVCLRGHVFKPHELDMEHPDQAWQREEHMVFYDQGAPECVVDFAHADNLVIATSLVAKALLYPMTHPEYVLVDDYWLSYVLSAKLGAQCIKIEAHDIFTFSDSADDPDVALYHNPLVNEQRVRLYIEHMLAGWPDHGQFNSSRHVLLL